MNIYQVRALLYGAPKTVLLLAKERPTDEEASKLVPGDEGTVKVMPSPVTEMTEWIAAQAEVNKAFRVLKARSALALYENDEEVNLTDLLVDLMHAAEFMEDGFAPLLSEARGHYKDELSQTT